MVLGVADGSASLVLCLFLDFIKISRHVAEVEMLGGGPPRSDFHVKITKPLGNAYRGFDR
jgi:hypothetical protein